MATNTNTIKTRIQLKSDTEANWNKAGPKDGSPGFIPLRGELIIYSADGTHAFSRLKIGDGETNVTALPFIDAGTLNGYEEIVVKKATFGDFPSPGSTKQLYVDLSTNRIYHFETQSGYTLLQNFRIITVGSVESFTAGKVTTAQVNDATLEVTTGRIPVLNWSQRPVMTEVIGE